MADFKNEKSICTNRGCWQKSCNYHDNIIQISRNNSSKPTNTDEKQNEILSKTPSGKTNIKEKDTVNQNSTENIKINENAEKEVRKRLQF